MKIDKIVANYIELRDAKQEMEREHERQLQPIKETMELAEQHMLAYLNEAGLSSCRTPFGLVQKSTKTSATVGNWDTAFEHIQKHELWHMLEHRVNKTSVEGYINEHGEPPPGVNVTRVVTVQFRRS